MDPARDAVGLHPGGGVDGVSPEVVAELALPDHAGDDRADVDPDPKLDRRHRLHRSVHGQRHLAQPAGMVRVLAQQSRSDHVRVPDRLDLLESVACGKAVEHDEDVIQQPD